MAETKTLLDKYLGDSPEELPDTADSRVLRGNGHVAKLAPAELVEREYRVLEIAEKHFPMRVPRLVNHGIFWVVMSEIPTTERPWADEELLAALSQLARLHESFLGSALLEEPWLRDPLDRDLEVLLAEARTLREYLRPELTNVLQNLSEIVDYLRTQPKTLLHGDPFPDNILRLADDVDPDSVATRPASEDARGQDPQTIEDYLVWIDWCHASIGPPAADLASWLDQTPFALGRPIDRLTHINTYLEAWENPPEREPFLKALDAARVLWFFAYDLPQLPLVATSDPDVVDKLNEEALRAYRAFQAG